MKTIVLLIISIGIITSVNAQYSIICTKDYPANVSGSHYSDPLVKAIGDTIVVIGTHNKLNRQILLKKEYGGLTCDSLSSNVYGKDSINNNAIIAYKFDSADNVYLLHNEIVGYIKSKTVIQKYEPGGNLNWIVQLQNPVDTNASFSPGSMGLINDTTLFVTVYENNNQSTSPCLYAFSTSGVQLWKRTFDPDTEIKYFNNHIFNVADTAYFYGVNNLGEDRMIRIDVNNNLRIKTNIGVVWGIEEMQKTPDNHLLIRSKRTYRISKLDLTGNVIWSKYYGTNLPSGTTGDEIRSIVQDSAGNIFVTGRHYGISGPNYTNADILTIKYDPDGTIIWENRFEYNGNNADIGNCMRLKNWHVFVGGTSQRLGLGTDYDYVMLKLKETTGILDKSYRYNQAVNGDDAISSLAVPAAGVVVLTGTTQVSPGTHIYGWTTQRLEEIIVSVERPIAGQTVTAYPNPVSSNTVLTIEGETVFETYSLYSVDGKLVQQGDFSENNIQQINIVNRAQGVYLLHLQSADFLLTKRIIVE